MNAVGWLDCLTITHLRLTDVSHFVVDGLHQLFQDGCLEIPPNNLPVLSSGDYSEFALFLFVNHVALLRLQPLDERAL